MKNKIITITFVSFLLLMSVFNMIKSSVEVSFAERRILKQYEDLDIKEFLSGSFIEDFEEVTLDQFVFRDYFRRIKAVFEFDVLNKYDNNDIVITDEGVFKLEYPLDEKSVEDLCKYINEINEKLLKESNVFISIIPDKNYYLNDDILKIDYEKLDEILNDNLNDITSIDIKDILDVDDYYLTDPHWKQENLFGVIDKLSDVMDFEVKTHSYYKKTFFPFYGSYYGQSALNIIPDTITYLVNDTILNAVVRNFENKDQEDVYVEDNLEDTDAYDVFLSGNSPLITIENPDSVTGKELVIFRDSFSSSLAPLLIESYDKITLVDLRFMPKDLLIDYVDFSNKDVLFMYSTLVVNNSNILK